MRLKDKLNIILVFAGGCLCGCGDYGRLASDAADSPVRVAIAVGEGSPTRTSYNVENKQFEWNDGDAVAVWARSSSGSYALDGQPFSLMAAGANRSLAYFTSTLPSPMDEGTYSYYVAYPSPESKDGTVARFTVPAVQDGAASDGVDIIVAEPVSGPALSPIEEASPISPASSVSVRMKHLLHFLRFYIPEGKNYLGEPVTRIEFSMPRPSVGKVVVDVTDPASAALEEGSNAVVLDLAEPLDEYGFAVAGIFPPSVAYTSSDRMEATVYSESKWAELNPVPLTGRTFSAGHLTPVPLRFTNVNTLFKLKFTLASNKLGEDPQSIRLSLPKGTNWPGSASNVLEFTGKHDGAVLVGDTFVLETKDGEAFKTLSSKELTVVYESESAIVSQVLTIADLSSVSSAVCSLDCPYLFFEDFSEVEGISSYDGYSQSNPGSRSPVSFLNGWSAARFGTEAGTSLRLACRRETSADYPARADSPFLSGLKEGVTVGLDVSFDYSMDRDGYGFIVSAPDISQTVHIGYITTPDNLKSGDDTGDFQDSFIVNETGGSYTNIGHSYSARLTNVKAPMRISWRTTPEHKAGTSNNTCWLYIDNIKVKITK